MGCGLNKLEKRSEKRPGNIYSTLKRPQVETKVDVAYEYRFLDFTTLSTAELPRSSAVRLSSLRDLPAQLLELYQQGFSLAALHPFVQPTHEWEKTPLQHIFRAILIKKTDRSQKTDVPNDGYVLELDCCSSLDHLTDQKIIPEFIKKVYRLLSFWGTARAASQSPLWQRRIHLYPSPAPRLARDLRTSDRSSDGSTVGEGRSKPTLPLPWCPLKKPSTYSSRGAGGESGSLLGPQDRYQLMAVLGGCETNTRLGEHYTPVVRTRKQAQTHQLRPLTADGGQSSQSRLDQAPPKTA